MAFGRSRMTATPSLPVRAAAGSARELASFTGWSVGTAVERAITIPTLTRAENLLVSLVGGMALEQFTSAWDSINGGYVEVELQSETWMDRPDPKTTRQFILGRTVSDLYWYSRAYWYVTSRYSNGYPASFSYLPAGSITLGDQTGPIWYGPSTDVRFNGTSIDANNVVQFILPTAGVLWTGRRMIEIAIRLDRAAARAASPIASGYLQQTGGEPMTEDELGKLAAAWVNNRAGSDTAEGTTVGALNELVKFVEFSGDPSKMQVTEGREYSALELSRVANVPPYILGIATGGMTYQNAQEAVRQLWLFGAKPIADCIQETLSLDTVIPRGRYVKFDVESMMFQAALDQAAQSLTDQPAPTGASA